MRYPKHPFSPDESAADARAESPDDRYDVTPDAAPDRGSGTPPPLPRRTGDSGFRPHEQPGPASQDSREAADPHGSRPLAPRPGAEPLDSWAHEDPQLAWVAVPPQDGTQDSSVPVDPQEAERAWPPSAPADEPQEPWAQGNAACPADAPAADEPQEPWAQGNYRPACPADAPAADERQEAWAQGNYRPACPADAPAADEPHEPWAQGNYRPACPADAPVADQPAERPVAGDRQQVWSDGMSPSGGAQDPWAYADPQDYRPPETPQEVEPREPWDYGDRGDSWPAEAAGQGSSGEPWDYADAGGDPRTQTPAQGQAQEPWADGDPEGSWDPAQSQPDWAPAPPAQADPDTSWTSPGAQQDWAPAPPVQVDPDTSWTSPGAQQDWPAPPAQAGPPRESWRPPERPPVAPDEPWLQAPETPRRRVRGWAGRMAALYRGELSQPESAAAEPRADRVAAGSGGSAEPEAGPVPASMGFQDLWESWEPPYDPVGSVSDRVVRPTAPYPEFVRDAEYEDDLWEIPADPAAAGSGDGGPRRGGQHARSLRRPRRGGGVILALAAALVIAAGVPIGMLAARTLAHHGDLTLKTAPLSASQTAGSARGAATFSALAGPGCPSVTSATVFPYHAPNGDGWHPATASGSGPCGSSFAFSYLAMVPANPGEWHDDYSWVFRTGMANPSCTFSLWIPAAPQANSNVYYWFSAGGTNANDRIADFTIDQATHQGLWVTHGPFTFPGGMALIEATDRGEGPPTATVAVGPVRLTC